MSAFGGQADEKKDASEKHTAKTGISHKQGVARRQQQGVKMRAKERDEMLKRRRRGEDENQTNDPQALAPAPERRMDPFAYTAKSRPTDIPVELLSQFVELCHSDDVNHVTQGTVMIRKMLSVEIDPPIDAVIATNVARKFVDFLGAWDYPVLQFESAWALTNIASGLNEHTNYIMNINAAPGLRELLGSSDDNCREQATWALGNLAGDNARCRDYILSLNVIQPMLHILSNNTEAIGVHRNAVWALANMCRGRPVPNIEYVGPCIPMFCSLLNSDDEEIQMDAAWGISYITEGGADRVAKLLTVNPLNILIKLLRHPNSAMITPAIRSIGSVVTGSDEQTNLAINAGCLAPMKFLLSHTRRGIRKEACWTLSNILAGTREQIDRVLQEELMGQLFNCMYAPEYEVKKEAVWAVANFTAGANDAQISDLVAMGGLDVICDVLSTTGDFRVLAILLEAIDNILAPAERYKLDNNEEHNVCAVAIMKNGGINAIERLQAHANKQVSERAGTILDDYFDVEDEEEQQDNSGGNNNNNAGNQGGFHNNNNGGGGNYNNLMN